MAAPVFDVHEWGLVDVAGGTARLDMGSPHVIHAMPVKKPVLYFHLADGAAPFHADVHVSIPSTSGSGRVVEHFPAGVKSDDGASIDWRGLRVRPGACGVIGAPTKESPACATNDGTCEAIDLPVYATSDASCIELPAGTPATANHLFYRGLEAEPPLPFEITATADSLSIKHGRADDAKGPLVVLEVAETMRARVVAVPAVGPSTSVPFPIAGDVGTARDAIVKSMSDAGLSSEEAAAFGRAWDASLFGSSATAKKSAEAPRRDLLYPLPPSLVSGVSTVTIKPPPRAFARFLLVRAAI